MPGDNYNSPDISAIRRKEFCLTIMIYDLDVSPDSGKVKRGF